MGGCCACRRVPERCRASCADAAPRARSLCAKMLFSFKMPRGVPQGRCRGVQSEAADEDCRARRRGPKDLFVNNSAEKQSFFDKLRRIPEWYPPQEGDQPKKRFRSSSTVPMPAMPKVSVSTLATLGERKAGRVGPRWMFFTPRWSRASRTITAFCSYQAML